VDKWLEWPHSRNGRETKLHRRLEKTAYDELQMCTLHKTLLAWARHIARMGSTTTAYEILVGKRERRPLSRPRRR
jgi:hypothetical protein